MICYSPQELFSTEPFTANADYDNTIEAFTKKIMNLFENVSANETKDKTKLLEIVKNLKEELVRYSLSEISLSLFANDPVFISMIANQVKSSLLMLLKDQDTIPTTLFDVFKESISKSLKSMVKEEVANSDVIVNATDLLQLSDRFDFKAANHESQIQELIGMIGLIMDVLDKISSLPLDDNKIRQCSEIDSKIKISSLKRRSEERLNRNQDCYSITRLELDREIAKNIKRSEKTIMDATKKRADYLEKEISNLRDSTSFLGLEVEALQKENNDKNKRIEELQVNHKSFSNLLSTLSQKIDIVEHLQEVAFEEYKAKYDIQEGLIQRISKAESEIQDMQQITAELKELYISNPINKNLALKTEFDSGIDTCHYWIETLWRKICDMEKTMRRIVASLPEPSSPVPSLVTPDRHEETKASGSSHLESKSAFMSAVNNDSIASTPSKIGPFDNFDSISESCLNDDLYYTARFSKDSKDSLNEYYQQQKELQQLKQYPRTISDICHSHGYFQNSKCINQSSSTQQEAKNSDMNNLENEKISNDDKKMSFESLKSRENPKPLFNKEKSLIDSADILGRDNDAFNTLHSKSSIVCNFPNSSQLLEAKSDLSPDFINKKTPLKPTLNRNPISKYTSRSTIKKLRKASSSLEGALGLEHKRKLWEATNRLENVYNRDIFPEYEGSTKQETERVLGVLKKEKRLFSTEEIEQIKRPKRSLWSRAAVISRGKESGTEQRPQTKGFSIRETFSRAAKQQLSQIQQEKRIKKEDAIAEKVPLESSLFKSSSPFEETNNSGVSNTENKYNNTSSLYKSQHVSKHKIKELTPAPITPQKKQVTKNFASDITNNYSRFQNANDHILFFKDYTTPSHVTSPYSHMEPKNTFKRDPFGVSNNNNNRHRPWTKSVVS